jgi:hypothetical protein
MGAGLIGAAVTFAALYVPGMRELEREPPALAAVPDAEPAPLRRAA